VLVGCHSVEDAEQERAEQEPGEPHADVGSQKVGRWHRGKNLAV
jgi:hypothetical protein